MLVMVALYILCDDMFIEIFSVNYLNVGAELWFDSFFFIIIKTDRTDHFIPTQSSKIVSAGLG